ncbi:MAG: peptidoglycan DD-metalloendopeptidase family protein [Chloroflexota bacterium]
MGYNDPQKPRPLRNWILFFALFFVIMIGAGLATYIAGTVGIRPAPDGQLETALLITPVATIDGTPINRFAQIDPVIANYLDSAPSNYGVAPEGILIQPVGIYLPRSGDTQFELADPTAFPTPLPFPTSPPLPTPALPDLPTVIPTDAPVPQNTTSNTGVVPPATAPENGRVLPYAGSGCAPSGLPVDGILTQRYHRYHGGIDIGVPLNTPVIATHSGQITYADWSTVGYGYLVIVQNDIFITYYAHNNSFNVSTGDFVGQGSIIAWSGSTGNSTGPHVHYETRLNDIPLDPLSFSSRGYPSC